MSLNVNDVVNVTVSMTPQLAQNRGFGSLLILGDSNVIDVSERMRYYTSITSVLGDFGTGTPEYQAANLYYSQQPTPLDLYIGRWASSAINGMLHGSALNTTQQLLTNFTGISSGSLAIIVDGTSHSYTGINLSGKNTLVAVAAAISTAITANASCIWNASKLCFDIISNTTGVTSSVAITSDTGALAEALGVASDRATVSVPGIAAEAALDAVTNLEVNYGNWYGLTLATTTSVSASSIVSIAAFIESATPSRIFGVTTQDANVLTNSTSDVASLLKAAAYKRTFVQYSGNSPYAAASIFGREFTVDFNGSNTVITVKFKTEPGITPETVTESQAAYANSKHCNIFVTYNNNTSIVQEGVMSNGYFIDEMHGADWLQNAIQTNIWNLLTSTTKVPMTNSGVNMILAACVAILHTATRNGLVGPGVWYGSPIGSLNTGDILTTGYYVYAAPIETLTSAQKTARQAPVIQIAVCFAGAIHFVNVQINVSR